MGLSIQLVRLIYKGWSLRNVPEEGARATQGAHISAGEGDVQSLKGFAIQ